eukprot:Skav210766  [mRNA]  locus=scaffold3955:76233:93031:+ [translate_table: standard]
MDPVSAERLIDRTSKWALGISTTTSATNRLMLLVAKQMEYLSYVVRAVADFKAPDLNPTCLILFEGDLVQVEAEVDHDWLFGYTAADRDTSGFIPRTYVERLGTGLGAQPQGLSPSTKPALKEGGLVVAVQGDPQQREIMSFCRGWLYGRPLGTDQWSWFPENTLAEVSLHVHSACTCADAPLDKHVNKF